MSSLVYKIAPASLWEPAQAAGVFLGAPIDVADGYIHLSAADQVEETARRYFAKQDDLLLIAVDVDHMGDALKWEASRGGALFPHLYAPLKMDFVVFVRPLPWVGEAHQFPLLEP